MDNVHIFVTCIYLIQFTEINTGMLLFVIFKESLVYHYVVIIITERIVNSHLIFGDLNRQNHKWRMPFCVSLLSVVCQNTHTQIKGGSTSFIHCRIGNFDQLLQCFLIADCKQFVCVVIFPKIRRLCCAFYKFIFNRLDGVVVCQQRWASKLEAIFLRKQIIYV